MMAVVTTALRDEILHTSNPAKLLDELNARLLGRMQQNRMNSALLVCVFDPFTRQAELANGGMVQPYLRTSHGWDFIAVGGYPLGASGRTGYSSKPIQFSLGSVLVFVSDGVTDAQRSDRELYGFDRLEALLQGLPETLTAAQIAAEIERSVRGFLGGAEPDDDLTIVVVKSIDQSIL
jgi:serine phosphatase RsbU (regulator of sigma subunit)